MKRAWISATFLLACGGTVSVPATTDAGSPLDAAAEAGACVASPRLGDPCAAGQTSCDHVDRCCGPATVCDDATHTWKDSAMACLLCTGFPCGPQTCTGGSVCVARAAGIPTPDGGSNTSYDCVPMPAACARDWTCGCVTKHPPSGCALPPAGGCDDPSLHVTLGCMGI